VKTIKSGCCLELSSPKDGDCVKLRGYNAGKKNFESSICVPILDLENESVALDTLDYKFIVDIDLQIFKSIVKVSQNSKINAETVNFKIYEHVDEKNENRLNKITVSLNMDNKLYPSTSYTFWYMTKWDRSDSKQTVIKNSELVENEEIHLDNCPLNLVLNEYFSTKYLNMFLKSMERPLITLKMSPGKPLVITYLLSAEEDIGNCMFIVAPSLNNN
jgi:hypothetical protein